MKKLVIGIIFIAVLMLVGCNDGVTNNQKDSTGNPISISNSSPTSNPTNYVKTYKDESHKQIQYGKLSFNIGVFHIVSQTRNDNMEIFKCEIDKGETRPETHMTIKVREIERKDFSDNISIVSYLSGMSPNYEKIRIYNNVTNDSEIISLYNVTGDGMTNYIVCYKDACYLVESDYSILEIYLFKNNPKANYEVNNLKIECANSFITNVNETIYYNKNKFDKAIYDIIQGKGGTKYSAELNFDNEEYINNFTLKNEEGDNLLTLSAEASGYNEDSAIKFLDVNMDGYVDIQFLEEEGTLNNSYALYVWDDSAKKFIKVKFNEMLSHFEVHNGYLQNWIKESENSGVIQKLVWENMNTLILESEEKYQMPTDDSDESTSNSDLIDELFSNYEKSIIEAINNNDLTVVEEFMVDGSNLYNSQKKLVKDLYTKNIQEKLVDYEIKDIETTGTEGEYKVYVNEKIGIKYSGKKDFVVKEFNWIYTVITAIDGRLRLTDIEKWK